MSPSTNPATGSGSTSGTGKSQAARTLTFVVAAVVCLGITAAIEIASRPAPIEEFGRIGEQFYPEFMDPTLAAGLEVYAFDAEEVLPQEFIVRREDTGRWVIPSRHDYPADADDQLAQTAASIIGIERGAMVTRWPADHAKYGVVNPRQDSLKVDEVEGVGKRLILSGDNDSVLADFIIGNQVDEDSTDEYYVRHPEEDEVYIATLDIDLSTKFADWIDTDMLHITAGDLVQLKFSDYAFNEVQGTLTQGAISNLTRSQASDPWVLEGINEDTEEVNADSLRNAASAIDNLKIVGVRPKQSGLTPELTLDRDVIQDQNDITIMQQDLLAQGFLLQPDDEPNTLKLLAREGELFASTSDGVTYRLYFGRAFTGSQEELEVGFTSDDSEEKSPEPGGDTEESQADEAGSDDADGETETADEEETSSSQPGRYVFVRVDFQESSLGDRPVEPVAPEMPEELKNEAEEDEAQENQAEGDSEEAAEDSESDEGSEETADDETAEEDPLAEIRQQWESAQAKYTADKATYDQALKDFEAKVEEGQKKAEELNRRFAEWYYVIPGESFEKLHLTRDDIVKEKEVTEEEASEESAAGTASPAEQPAAPESQPEAEPTTESGESAPSEEPEDSEGETSASDEESTADDDAPAEESEGPADETEEASTEPPADEPEPSAADE